MDNEVINTPFGKFQINPRDGIGMTLKAGTLWDGPGFLQVIAREYGLLGTPGVTVLDVGANIGSFSVWLASQGAWRVLAFEPVPQTMLALKANLDLNKATTAAAVIPIQIAAYDRATRLMIRGSYNRNDMGATALVRPESNMVPDVEIPTARLDTYNYLFGERVSLIKIDAQGCDGAAIMGLQETIRRDHPAVVFEWEERLAKEHGYQFLQIRDIFSSLGYMVNPWPSQPDNYIATWINV